MEFVRLNENHAQEVFELSERIYLGMPNKDHLRRNGYEAFLKVLQGLNVSFGCYEGDKLVGCAMAVLEGEDIKVELTHPIEGKGGYYKIVMVDAIARGQGLQKRLSAMVEKEVKALGFDWLWLTVAPTNTYSSHNFRALGYEVAHQELKYGGKLRNVMYKVL